MRQPVPISNCSYTIVLVFTHVDEPHGAVACAEEVAVVGGSDQAAAVLADAVELADATVAAEAFSPPDTVLRALELVRVGGVDANCFLTPRY